MPNNINNKNSGGWGSKAGRNGSNTGSNQKQGSGNPSMQDKDTDWATNNTTMKATSHMDMTSDGGVQGHDDWKGNVSC